MKYFEACLVVTLVLTIQCLKVHSHPVKNQNQDKLAVETDEERSKFVDDFKNNLIHAIEKLKVSSDHQIRLARQDEEEEDELPELVPGILKIVGSAIAGNATALIDSSISLIPQEIHSSITGALNVLVNTINSARPTQAPVKTATSSTPAEEEEEGTDLKANSTGSANITSTLAPSSNPNPSPVKISDTMNIDMDVQSVDTLNSSSLNSESNQAVDPSTLGQTMLTLTTTTESPIPPSPRTIPTTTSTTTTTTTTTTTSATTTTSTLPPVVKTVAPVPVTASADQENLNNLNFIGAPFDTDNKANWISLLGTSFNNNTGNAGSIAQSESFANPSDYTDTDNKANFASLLIDSPAINVAAPKIPDVAVSSTSSNINKNSEILSSSQNSPSNTVQNKEKNPAVVTIITNKGHVPVPVRTSSSVTQHSLPLSTSINAQKPFFSLSIRDNSKAPGLKLASSNTLGGNGPSNNIQQNYVQPEQPGTSSSLGNKLTALLLSNSKPVNSFIDSKLSGKETEEASAVKVSQGENSTASLTPGEVSPGAQPELSLSNNEEQEGKEQEGSSPNSNTGDVAGPKSTTSTPLISNYADRFSYGPDSNLNSTVTAEPQFTTTNTADERTTTEDEDEEEDEDTSEQE